MWLEDTLENRKNLRSSFSKLGYGDFSSLETMQFVPGWTNFLVGGGIELDIMTTMKGLENISFAESLAMASTADLDGVEVRPKDQVDVIELEKIRKFREEEK